LAWHRDLVRKRCAVYRERPSRGRAPLAQECRELIVRIARENPSWGYFRIRGELYKLGYTVSATTIRSVLRRAHIPRAGPRSKLTWKQFIAAHAETLAPRANAHAERWIGSCRRECLDWMLIASEDHLRRVLRQYQDHYNDERLHRSRDLRPPSGRGDPPETTGDTINRHTRLGGLLSHYRWAA
jgi:hypothetical protein